MHEYNLKGIYEVGIVTSCARVVNLTWDKKKVLKMTLLDK